MVDDDPVFRAVFWVVVAVLGAIFLSLGVLISMALFLIFT